MKIHPQLLLALHPKKNVNKLCSTGKRYNLKQYNKEMRVYDEAFSDDLYYEYVSNNS